MKGAGDLGRQSALLKVQRPPAEGIFRRDRLFQRLEASGGAPAVWISGPAGSGKTALASSYLETKGVPR